MRSHLPVAKVKPSFPSVHLLPFPADVHNAFQISHADKSFHIFSLSQADKANWLANLQKHINKVALVGESQQQPLLLPSLPHSLPACLTHSLPACLPYSLPACLPHLLPACLTHSLSACLPHSLPACLPHSLPACLPASLPACLPHSLPVCLPASLTPCLPACLTPCLPHSLPACLPASLPACLTPCLPHSLPACLPASLPACLTPCLPHSLPACLPHSLPACLPPGGNQSVVPRAVWVPDSLSKECMICSQKFSAFNRKHHCRQCGRVVCSTCSPHRVVIDSQTDSKPERVCSGCMKEISDVKCKGGVYMTLYQYNYV